MQFLFDKRTSINGNNLYSRTFFALVKFEWQLY